MSFNHSKETMGMYKPNSRFNHVPKGRVSRHGHIYPILFACMVVFLIYSSQVTAITPAAMNTHAIYKQDTVSQLGTQENSDLQLLVRGLKAFGREDYQQAANLMLPLADKGVSEAQFYMGMMSDAGLGTDKDVEQAYLWYLAAAQGGHPSAQHNLAVAYAQGEGVTPDPEKAVYWWQRAAKQGNADAQYNLGIVYAVGKLGVKQDLEVAKEWWSKAANNGDGMAQYNLGILYANNKKSTGHCDAKRWWEKSAENGVAQAGIALELLKLRKDYKSCM